MRAPLIRAAAAALAVAFAAPARAGAPLALVERQVATLEFDRPVARVSVTDPELVAVDADGVRLRVRALRAGRGTLEVAFEDGAAVTYDVSVAGARRAAAAAPTAGAREIDVAVGARRRVAAPGVARAFVEENGVARVVVDGRDVVIDGLAPGTASLVLVDEAGARTSWTVRVR